MKSKIKGITVILYTKIESDVDEFNRPIYETRAEQIKNVLVAPSGGGSTALSASDGIINELNLNGKQVKYVLAIPKGDTHDWNDKTVEFFGQKFRTIGTVIQGIEDNIPLDWNKKIAVEDYIDED